ncbi:hypothetical protein O4328_39545 [Rhodococcus opacus]|uniref:Tyr recombinase domain-containing protein n=1 Tax=Rhodococcus opacus TaxID=37919 RepID=A0AAX3YSM2_RHOOP|nr:hypothetical protein [Rhodococcus opacus]MCZ4589667.1 hypothetical protein [Rhodococcus opacus]WLF51479.1 hypothetical protein Q5707_38080 [Rhodococcus opacus]
MRETVELSGPTLHSQAANALKALSRFAVWAIDVGFDLDREVVLVPEVVERYRVTGMRELAPTSRSTEISRLRRVARAVTRRAPWPAPGAGGSRQGLSPPYTEAQIAGYWEAALCQNGPFRVQAMTATLALTAGVGARPGELFAVTAADVIEVDGVVAVVLGPESAGRVVPVRASWVDRLERVATGAGAGPLVASHRAGADQAAALLASFEYPAGLPRLTVARLRSTWLTGVLSDCGVAEIFAAAGIVSGKSFSDLVPYLAVPQVGSLGWRRLTGGS